MRLRLQLQFVLFAIELSGWQVVTKDPKSMRITNERANKNNITIPDTIYNHIDNNDLFVSLQMNISKLYDMHKMKCINIEHWTKLVFIRFIEIMRFKIFLIKLKFNLIFGCYKLQVTHNQSGENYFCMKMRKHQKISKINRNKPR